MGLFDAFKSFIGNKQKEEIGPRELPRDVLEDLQNKKDNDHYKRSDNFQYPNRFGHSNQFEEEIRGSFSEMDAIMKSLLNYQPDFRIQYDEPNNDTISRSDNQALRDKMFDGGNNDNKIYEFGGTFNFPFHNRLPELPHHSSEEDNDLDNNFDSGTHSLDDLLKGGSFQSKDQIINHPRRSIFDFSPFSFFNGSGFIPEEHTDFSSAFKYSSIRKKLNPDGSIETHTTKRDSDGNEEVVIRRSVGDQTHIISTKKNSQGEEEKTENFINMEQDDITKFEERWKNKQSDPRDRVISTNPSTVPRDEGWSGFFSSWWKPKI